MPEFLTLKNPSSALGELLGLLEPNPIPVEIPVSNALGRITFEKIFSLEASPAFTRSTVDGYAVKSVDTFGSSETLPNYLKLVGEVPMGAEPEFAIRTGETVLIHTGGMLPEGADAVLMLEYSQLSRAGEIEVLKAVAAGENLAVKGEDVVPGQEIVGPGTIIRPAEIGGLLALGINSVKVCQPPRVGIISTGDEVIPADETPRLGQVRNINSHTLAALVQVSGGLPVSYGIIGDNQIELTICLKKALTECDLVVITAGSSASQRDLTSAVIHEIGKPGVLVHGVNIKPGKPTILGMCSGKPVIGLPGNPVSALVIAGLFVKPVIQHMLGIKPGGVYSGVTARLKVNISSQAGREDYIPVKLEKVDGEYLADPVFFKSTLIFSLVRADGLAFIPAPANGLGVGETVQVSLF